MATSVNRDPSYLRQLDAWHLELAIVRNVVDHILAELDGPDWMTSAAHVARDRFAHLIETFPFPTNESVTAGSRSSTHEGPQA